METISYAKVKQSGCEGYLLENAPEKVMRFGEGNFLRDFAAYWFDMSNKRQAGTASAFWYSPSLRA